MSLVVQAGTIRLRPVMLTTLTTVFGLMPLAMNFSVDLIARDVTYGGALSSLWVPLSQAIVWGLGFASLLTLIVTPAMLTLPDSLKRRLLSLRALLPSKTQIYPNSAPGFCRVRLSCFKSFWPLFRVVIFKSPLTDKKQTGLTVFSP